MALNRSDKSRILRRYSPGMTRNSEMSTEPSLEALDNQLRKIGERLRPFATAGCARCVDAFEQRFLAKLPPIQIGFSPMPLD